MTRADLPQRRECERTEFKHAGMRFTMTFSRFHDGRVAELFLGSGKSGTAIQAIARDSAIIASIALQRGSSIEELHHGITKDDSGQPASLLGKAVELLAKGGVE